MSAGNVRSSVGRDLSLANERVPKPHRVIVKLTNEQLAAAEGWRSAHGIEEQSEALGELVRLGLLSEIAKIYRLVSDNRNPPAPRKREVVKLTSSQSV
jgi:hypothetical protein